MKKVKIQCCECGRYFDFEITDEQYNDLLENKKNIQNIFPDMEPEYRELFITRICPECWDEMFPYDEEND